LCCCYCLVCHLVFPFCLAPKRLGQSCIFPATTWLCNQVGYAIIADS
jgi:hypothetical protein